MVGLCIVVSPAPGTPPDTVCIEELFVECMKKKEELGLVCLGRTEPNMERRAHGMEGETVISTAGVGC